jgi:hypothetical protein
MDATFTLAGRPWGAEQCLSSDLLLDSVVDDLLQFPCPSDGLCRIRVCPSLKIQYYCATLRDVRKLGSHVFAGQDFGVQISKFEIHGFVMSRILLKQLLVH